MFTKSHIAFFTFICDFLHCSDQLCKSNTYFIMLSLTLDFKGIIPKLMALQRGWFKHTKRDFKIFASLGTKRIGTWPYLTSPWVTGCPNMLLCLIFLLTFYFLGDIPFHRLPFLFKWTRLWTWTL